MIMEIGTRIINTEKIVEVEFVDNQVVRYDPEEIQKNYLNPEYVIAAQILND